MRFDDTRRVGSLLLLASLAMGAGPPPRESTPRRDAFGDPIPPGALARMGTLRLRHGAPVAAVVYSPDGSFVAAAGQDRTVRLWDPATGKQMACLRGHAGSIQSLALSPDGGTLASGGQDGTIRLWGVKGRTAAAVSRQLIGHENSVHALTFTRDGKLISGGWDGTIRIWDAAGKVSRSFGAGRGQVRSLALLPGGKELAAAHLVGDFPKVVASIHLWDVAGGKHLREVVGGQKTIHHIAISPDGNTLASAGDAGPKVWEVASGTPLVRLRQDKGHTPCVIFAPNGRTLLAGGSGFLTEFDLPAGTPRRSFDAGAFYTYAAAFSPDGKTLATGGTRTVGLWDVATAKPRLALVGHEGEISALAFTPDGKELLTAGYGRPIFRWDALTGRRVGVIDGPQSGWNSTLVLSPDGKSLAAFGGNLSVALLDPATGRPGTTFTKHLPPRSSAYTQMNVLFAPDGNTLFSSTHGIDFHIRRWDADTGKEVLAIPVGKELTLGLALSPDGRTLYSASRSGPVRVRDAATGKELRQIGKSSGAAHLALSPDGRSLAAVLVDRGCVWEAATGREMFGFPRPVTGFGACLAFSPDGRTLAVVGTRGTRMLFWELASGRPRLEFDAPDGAVDAIAFSPDGRLFATGGGDTTALVWDFRALPLLGEPDDNQMSPKRLGERIAELSDPNGVTAFRAVCALARAPAQAVPAFAARMLPADPKRIAKLVELLGDDDFEAREQATRDLTGLGTSTEAALRRAVAANPDVDVRLRAAVILRALGGPADTLRLRGLRTLEVLEAAGTPAARGLVERMAGGPAEVELTQEARRTLGRMAPARKGGAGR